MRRRTLPLLVIAAAFSLPAGAQTPPAAAPNGVSPKSKAVLPRVLADAMTKKARDLYLEGTDAMAKGQIADARAAFVGAWALEQHYSIACNLGDAELRLGRPRDAADRLALCVREIEKDTKATEAERGSVRKLFADAKSRVVELVVRGPESGGPAGVTAFVDGAPVGQAPPDLTAYLEPGKHVLTLVAQGYDEQRVEIGGAAGSREEVRAALKSQAAATATATATSVVPPPPRSLVPAFVLGGVGLASAIAGAVLVGSSAAMGSDMLSTVPVTGDGKPACRRTPEPAASATAECDAWRARGAEASTLGNVGIGLFVVAGLAGAGAAGYALWPSITGRPSAVTWRLSPVVTAQEGGVRIEGKF